MHSHSLWMSFSIFFSFDPFSLRSFWATLGHCCSVYCCVIWLKMWRKSWNVLSKPAQSEWLGSISHYTKKRICRGLKKWIKMHCMKTVRNLITAFNDTGRAAGPLVFHSVSPDLTHETFVKQLNRLQQHWNCALVTLWTGQKDNNQADSYHVFMVEHNETERMGRKQIGPGFSRFSKVWEMTLSPHSCHLPKLVFGPCLPHVSQPAEIDCLIRHTCPRVQT